MAENVFPVTLDTLRGRSRPMIRYLFSRDLVGRESCQHSGISDKVSLAACKAHPKRGGRL